ncbi:MULTISPECIES: sulfatase-like hydrolase/transferase [unclassified Novosphingobium]|uniref:sulfatase-like hydrolase/transferase n=1 Tax=unclassified Novosphingobium TaxID=2644732 RepID=UPI000A9E8DB7|nr:MULTISPECIES: sulfatase-like hydrolase/transferase [unclassified Novosphingobium]MDR6710322.1 choline-sulfatase [Novosphingobium sp. 1748]
MNVPLTRRNIMGGIGAGMLSGVLSHADLAQAAPLAVPVPSSAGSRPNLILFFPDELRADALACYGNPVTRTPNFDRLAKSGTMFRNAHVQYPVCAASRCSMLTGLPTSATGHRGFSYLIQPNEPNLFAMLRQSGYDTFFFGKNDVLAPETFATSLTAWADPPAPGAASGDHAPGARAGVNNGPVTMLLPPMGDRRETSDYGIIQRAIHVIERKESDRPFCLFLPIFQPHPPYRAPADFAAMYKPEDLPALIPPGLSGKPAYHEAIRRAYGLDKAGPEVFARVRAAYYGQVSYADWLLGELLDALERTGRDKDTAVFVGSDHGDYAGDYGLVEKWHGGLESCLTHVPLIGRVPGVAGGHVAQDMVELYDIMPSFLSLAGARSGGTQFGRSLLPQIHGGAGDPNRAAFTEAGINSYEPQAFDTPSGGLYRMKSQLAAQEPVLVSRAASVRTQRHTYIHRPQGQSEFYDRIADPGETRNLIGTKAVAKDQAALQQRLLNWYVNTSGVPQDTRNSRDVPNFIPPQAPKPEAPDRILDL